MHYLYIKCYFIRFHTLSWRGPKTSDVALVSGTNKCLLEISGLLSLCHCLACSPYIAYTPGEDRPLVLKEKTCTKRRHIFTLNKISTWSLRNKSNSRRIWQYYLKIYDTWWHLFSGYFAVCYIQIHYSKQILSGLLKAWQSMPKS